LDGSGPKTEGMTAQEAFSEFDQSKTLLKKVSKLLPDGYGASEMRESRELLGRF